TARPSASSSPAESPEDEPRSTARCIGGRPFVTLGGNARLHLPTGRAPHARRAAVLAEPPLPHLRESGGKAGAADRASPALGGGGHRARERAAEAPRNGGSAAEAGDPAPGRRADRLAQ